MKKAKTMALKTDEFLKRLLATFKVEAEEHVNALASGLVSLEKVPAGEQQLPIVEAIFREAHSLKGAARTVNQGAIEAVCQSVESVLSSVKRNQINLSPPLFDLLHQAVDSLARALQSAGVKETADEQFRATNLIQALEKAGQGAREAPGREEEEGPAPEVPAGLKTGTPIIPREEKAGLAETVRISSSKLNSLLLQAEELLPAKSMAGQRVSEIREINAGFLTWKKERSTIDSHLRVLQQSEPTGRSPGELSDGPNGKPRTPLQLATLLAFLEWNDVHMKSLEDRLTGLGQAAGQDHRLLSRAVEDLLDSAKKVAMLPFSSLLDAFPKLVRDLARDRGKNVELTIQGAEIEADRRVLEQMKDPLVHLVRNCIDHGIEKAQERERQHKPARGTITIALSHQAGDKTRLLVSDDGAGIDLEKISAAAIKLGIVPPEKAGKMGEQERLSLVFESGVSTSSLITEISGRGLGLAIVREKVEAMGGRVSLETRPGRGATFRITLPVTLATFRGVVVRADEHLFVVPAVNVERAMRVAEEEIKTVENRETIEVNEQVVSFVRLGQVLELLPKNETAEANHKKPVLILGAAENRMAFLVDEVLGEQEVLVKGLGKQLSRVRNVAGATILASGKVVPVLNVPDLMRSAIKISAGAPRRFETAAPEIAARKSILVAEDSITARTLLKNILEAAGYNVKAAVDGMEAFTTLRTEEFDLVVSDVDMPRMTGFDLTAKIRADKKLSELPVVLVTALESREDRERGILVGANAYIVKKSFDQSNLLEVIRRLI